MDMTREEKHQILFSLNLRMDLIQERINHLWEIGGEANDNHRKKLVKKYYKINQLGRKIGGKLWLNY